MYGMIRQHVLKRLFDMDLNTGVLEVLACPVVCLGHKMYKNVCDIQLIIKLNVLPDKTCSLWRI